MRDKPLDPVVGSEKDGDWHERFPEALWAYRTTYRTPTQCTPYSLVFGPDAETTNPLFTEPAVIAPLYTACHFEVVSEYGYDLVGYQSSLSPRL